MTTTKSLCQWKQKSKVFINSGKSTGIQTCHRTGESAVATGAEGAEGVCVLMIYCSGAEYLRKTEKLNPW